MSSATEVQESFDDFIEIPSTDHPLSYPIVVAEHFDKKPLARAFRIEGGGNVTVKPGPGKARELTALPDPYYLECKITEVTIASTATKIVLFV